MNESASEKTSVFNRNLANAYSVSGVSSRGSSARLSGKSIRKTAAKNPEDVMDKAELLAQARPL